MRRFFAPSVGPADKTLLLSPDETHHLRDVLRLSAGDEVQVFDGLGREYLCRISSSAKSGAELEIMSEIPPLAPESTLDLTLAATVLNGERFDLVVQKSVELGVTRLIPMHSIRGEVKVSDARRRVERWKRIAMEATKQCGRSRLMAIGEPSSFGDLIRSEPPASIILFSERDGSPLPQLPQISNLTALVGPKGGWDDAELELAGELGVSIVTLGGRILRAETAAISLTTILQHRFGDLN